MNVNNRVSIVLVEPQSPGNVGMVCRAMKNMGVSDLRLVNPCPIDHPEALKFAVSARDLLERARIFPSLAEALADTSVSVATTRRHGKYRQEIYSPAEVARKITAGDGGDHAALVFGREDSGLTTEEVSLCTWHATIATSPDYGSMNLAQSVLVFCYELFGARNTGEDGQPAVRDLAGSQELETLYGHMERTLMRIGFLNPQNPAHLMRTLRRIYARAGLDTREVAVLRGLMSQIDWAASDFEGKKKR
jgi:tRNA/rRNA methyltransferase